MAYYTRQQLQSVPIYLEAAVRNNRYHTRTASAAVTVFLSHSHQDAAIVNQAVQLLGSQGVTIYVDWKDESMPSVTSPETARRIKGKIKECKKLVLLATNNALQSKWVPWELGVADAENSMKNIAILPVTDSQTSWIGSEYVGIYDRIEQASSGKPAVFEPGASSGILLEDWLRR
ncbi:toll/interleukin-1 receptor domain-containing protein [Botrimarina colliarenosi]|nr:toll/interleukin-1 receptor domain-containing protein [Botrimarina colliarenosi]